MTEKHYAVAIDGPSGAGKSTLARAAAEALHILYVDTGAIYRTIGVYMYRHDIQPTDAAAVTAALPEITVSLRYDEDGLQRMYLNGEDVTKEQRRGLVQVLKHFALDVTGTRPVSEAIVTAGGVKVGEVAPNTMASKRVDGLYFAGEVLDVDAYTGGFNLQIAWATGYLAGLSAAESEEMYD